MQNELAKAADWEGKIVIDATNAYGVSPDELGRLPSSVVNARGGENLDSINPARRVPGTVLREAAW